MDTIPYGSCSCNTIIEKVGFDSIIRLLLRDMICSSYLLLLLLIIIIIVVKDDGGIDWYVRPSLRGRIFG